MVAYDVIALEWLSRRSLGCCMLPLLSVHMVKSAKLFAEGCMTIHGPMLQIKILHSLLCIQL